MLQRKYKQRKLFPELLISWTLSFKISTNVCPIQIVIFGITLLYPTHIQKNLTLILSLIPKPNSNPNHILTLHLVLTLMGCVGGVNLVIVLVVKSVFDWKLIYYKKKCGER